MQIYLGIDQSKTEDEDQARLQQQLDQLISDITQFLDANPGLQSTLHPESLCFHMRVKRSKHLQPVIKFCNTLSQQYQIDFVVGIEDNNLKEDVCFFGFEEGKGDADTIAMYLGLT